MPAIARSLQLATPAADTLMFDSSPADHDVIQPPQSDTTGDATLATMVSELHTYVRRIKSHIAGTATTAAIDDEVANVLVTLSKADDSVSVNRAVSQLAALSGAHRSASTTHTAAAGTVIQVSWIAELMCARLRRYAPNAQPPQSRLFNLDHSLGFESNADVAFAKAEAYYYQHDSIAALGITRRLVAADPRNAAFVTLHVAVLLSLRLVEDLFALAHVTVAAEPRSALSWYIVGCYGLAVARGGVVRPSAIDNTSATGSAVANMKAKAKAGAVPLLEATVIVTCKSCCKRVLTSRCICNTTLS